MNTGSTNIVYIVYTEESKSYDSPNNRKIQAILNKICKSIFSNDSYRF